MKLQIIGELDTQTIKITDLDRNTHDYASFDLKKQWYRITIPSPRRDIKDIRINGESINHCLNAGAVSEKGYEIWVHGDLSVFFSRIARCIAQDDLLTFKNLNNKYLLCESWNEPVSGDFIPTSVKQFFSKGEGPHWYHRDDWVNLPYINYTGGDVTKDLEINKDLTFKDKKFYGRGVCRSLKPNPSLPTVKTGDLESEKLKQVMEAFGFTELLQMQYIELQPNSVLPIHRDDWTYQTGRSILDGPSQLYFVLSGSTQDIKFKFENVGLIDVDRPIFINNRRFVHSLIYTGKDTRGVFLAYGIRIN